MTYYPRVSEERATPRKESKVHYSVSATAVRTECGLSTDNMSQRCLDEMSLEDAMSRADSCRRCISAMV